MATQSSGHGTPAGRPIALVVSGPRGGKIIACCDRAAAQGVQPGMPVAEAQSLVRKLAIAPHDPAADRRALEKLAEACEQFTPCVALEEGDEPESLLLDISNLEHLYGSESKLAGQVQKFFTRREFQVRLAAAPTIGLAWALAHFGEEDCKLQISKCKLSIAELPSAARTNTSQFAFCNLPFVIPSLSVEALRIPADTASLLRQLGIETVDQLLSLPREDLTSRFGGALLRRLDQFTGAAREVIEPHRGLPPLTARWALDEPTADRAMLLHVLGELVERLARQLAARDLGAVILMCVLHASGGTLGACDGRGANVQTRSLAKPQDGLPEWAGGRIVPLRIGLVEPSADVRQLLELIELHLETVRLAGEVGRVEIRAAVVGRLGQRQRELFADRWPADPHQLALLVNRLSSRLGDEQVLRAELRASAVPERAFRYVPLTQCRERERGRGGDKKKASTRRSHLPISLSPCLPLLLHTQPQALEVVCIAPDGPPQFVWLEGRRERILHCAGPERIETLWWRGPSVRRDYYRIAAESGSHLWIFRRLTDRRWFLHGTFA